MKPIIRFSMKNTVAIFLLILMLVGGGVYSISQMKMEKYPNVGIPYLHFVIPYPGASPEQVMRDIGKPVEQELRNSKGFENVYTTAQANVLFGTAQIPMSTSIDEGMQELRTAIGKVKLPDTADTPTFSSEEMDADVFSFALSGGKLEEVQTYVQNTLLPQLKGIAGVKEIETAGIFENEVQIRLRPDAMKEHGLTFDQVNQTIQANNASIPIGDLITGDRKLPIRADKTLTSLEQIKQIPILSVSPTAAVAGGNPIASVQLGEIADVDYEAPAHAFPRLNGESAVMIAVLANGGEDAVQIAKDAKAIVAAAALPAGVQMTTLQDRSLEIEHSVNSMLREVALGAIMATIVTLLFLRNLRSTIIAIISIPLSMFASFIVIGYLGYTLNMMTLAGIAVAIGRVVDDSIVVIENIFRRVRSARDRDGALVEQATHEVASAITSSTLTTVAVFLPLAFVPGIVGKFFVPLAWTIVVSLLFSLLVAVSVVPLLSRLSLLKLKHHEPKKTVLQRIYGRSLAWTLKHRLVTLTAAIIVWALSIGLLAPTLGFNFLPSEQTRDYNVGVKLPVGTSLGKTEDKAKDIETIIRQTKGIERVTAYVGAENANLKFVVGESIPDPDGLVADLRKQLDAVQGVSSMTISGQQAIGGSASVEVFVNGPNLTAIQSGADQIVGALKNIEGLANVRSTAEGEKPEIAIAFNDQKLAENGFMPAAVALQLRNMMNGVMATKIDMNGQTTAVRLTMQTSGMNAIDLFKEQRVTNPLGKSIAIQELGTISEVKNRTSISHENQKEFIQISGTITISNTSKVSADAQAAINALKLPNGVTWSSVGAAKEMNDGFINMGIALAISILLVYMVMLIAFSDWKVPLIILVAIPFSMIGAVLGLYAVGEPIGMPALIGLLMLNGIVVTNAIVLLERVRTNMNRGMAKYEALIEGGSTRLRPILMTAIATVGALIPLALSAEAGVVSRALAVVVIGGLATSTFLTLYIVPVLFSLVMRERKDVQHAVIGNGEPATKLQPALKPLE